MVEGVSESQHRNCKHHSTPGLRFFDKVHGINKMKGAPINSCLKARDRVWGQDCMGVNLLRSLHSRSAGTCVTGHPQ